MEIKVIPMDRIEWLANYTPTIKSGAYDCDEIKALARLLLEERKQPKVWDEAPEWALSARTKYFDRKGNVAFSQNYHREPPKSPIRQIAEKYAAHNGYFNKEVADVIESAIIEAMALEQ